MNISSNKVVFFDLDGTLIKGQSQLLLLKYLYKRKIVGITEITKIFFYYFLFKMGYKPAMQYAWQVALRWINGKNVIEVEALLNDFIELDLKKHFYLKSLEILNDYKASGKNRIVILSSAADILVRNISKYLGLNDYIATKIVIQNSNFCNRIDGKIVFGKEKLIRMLNFLNLTNLSISNTVAYADDASDLPLLRAVKEAYIVNPKRKMMRIGKKFEIGIIYTNR